MTSKKKIVLDANILVRGVLGVGVPNLLERYHHHVLFYTPSECFADARDHLPTILNRRSQVDVDKVLSALDALRAIVQSVDETAYAKFKADATQRILERDPDDWPLIALALALDCPLWTEDRRFLWHWRCHLAHPDFMGSLLETKWVRRSRRTGSMGGRRRRSGFRWRLGIRHALGFG